MIKGDAWVLDHLRMSKGSGNTAEGRTWTQRVRQEVPFVTLVCDQCGSEETISPAVNMRRTRYLFRKALQQEECFGGYRCASCGWDVAREKTIATKATPEWKELQTGRHSWQSLATQEQLDEWAAKGQATRLATYAAMTPDQRGRGVRKQWELMTPEVKAQRASRIGQWSKASWAALSPTDREARIRNMIKGLPRSRISDVFREALVREGLYEGFSSEVAVSGFIVDEADVQRKLIIEFHGDYYHCNPRKFTDPDWVNPTLRMTAAEKWKYDRRRLAGFLKLGYRVLIVWEDEWRGTPTKALARVQHFLKDQP